MDEIRETGIVGNRARAAALLYRTRSGDLIHAAFEALLLSHPRDEWLDVLVVALEHYSRSFADPAEAIAIAARYLPPKLSDAEAIYALRLVKMAWDNSVLSSDLARASATIFGAASMKTEQLRSFLEALVEMHPMSVYPETGTGVLRGLLEGVGDHPAFMPELTATVLDRKSDIPMRARISWLVRALCQHASISDAAPQVASLHAALLSRLDKQADARGAKGESKGEPAAKGAGRLAAQHLLGFYGELEAHTGVLELRGGTVPAEPAQGDNTPAADVARSQRMQFARRLDSARPLLTQLQAQIAALEHAEPAARKLLSDRMAETLALVDRFTASGRVAEAKSEPAKSPTD